MNLEPFIIQFADNSEAIRSIVQNVSEEQARWKPDPAAWSMVEVINHLYDEEREDFRARLDLLLHHPGRPWPDNDPERWVVERQYQQRPFKPSLENFLAERQESLVWLQGLPDPNWAAVYSHPDAGSLSAADLLAAWLAHDLLHLRQLAELHFAYLSQALGYNIDYAGTW